MRRNLVDLLCTTAILLILGFLVYLGEKPKSPTEVHWGPTQLDLFKSSGIFGSLQLVCLVLGAVKLVRCAVVTRESKLAGPALLSEIRKQLDEGQIDRALSQAKSDAGYAGRVLAGALSRKAVGGDVRRGFEDAAALEYSRLRGRVDTLLGIGVVGFLLGLGGAVHGLTIDCLILRSFKEPTFGEATYWLPECLVRLTYGFIIALIFVPAFLVMKRRVSTTVSKVNVELGDLLDRAAPQK
jgi:hypothetical protein